MKKGFAVFMVLLAVLGIILVNRTCSELPDDYEAEINTIVSAYYDCFSNEDFTKALSYVDIPKEKHDFQIKHLLESRNIYNYKMTPPYDNKGWVRSITYDKKSNYYIVEAVAGIKYQGEERVQSDLVYLKKINGIFKIVKIVTDDPHYMFRGEIVKGLE